MRSIEGKIGSMLLIKRNLWPSDVQNTTLANLRRRPIYSFIGCYGLSKDTIGPTIRPYGNGNVSITL